MKRGRIQAKDLPDVDVMRAVRRLNQLTEMWAMIWDLRACFPQLAHLSTLQQERVLRAKLAALIRRKLMDGCTCGCRGDFELTDAGETLLALADAAPPTASP